MRSRSSDQVRPRALFLEYLRRRRAGLAVDRLAINEAVAAFRRGEAQLARDVEAGRQTWLPIALEEEIAT